MIRRTWPGISDGDILNAVTKRRQVVYGIAQRARIVVTIGIVRETRTAALKLPKEAVIRELRSAHVFVAEDDVAVKREVTLGLEEGEWVEALAGVEQGEQVIVLGQGGLKDGSQIKILGPNGEELQES